MCDMFDGGLTEDDGVTFPDALEEAQAVHPSPPGLRDRHDEVDPVRVLLHLFQRICGRGAGRHCTEAAVGQNTEGKLWPRDPRLTDRTTYLGSRSAEASASRSGGRRDRRPRQGPSAPPSPSIPPWPCPGRRSPSPPRAPVTLVKLVPVRAERALA